MRLACFRAKLAPDSRATGPQRDAPCAGASFHRRWRLSCASVTSMSWACLQACSSHAQDAAAPSSTVPAAAHSTAWSATRRAFGAVSARCTSLARTGAGRGWPAARLWCLARSSFFAWDSRQQASVMLALHPGNATAPPDQSQFAVMSEPPHLVLSPLHVRSLTSMRTRFADARAVHPSPATRPGSAIFCSVLGAWSAAVRAFMFRDMRLADSIGTHVGRSSEFQAMP